MASYRKLKSSWQVQVCCNGVRRSKTFPTKGECQGWAENLEHKIRHGKYKHDRNHLLDDALERYLIHVVPLHRGERRERIFIAAFRRDEIALKRVSELTPDDIAKWRDKRLESVSNGSVNRELNILSAVLTTCEREWGWVESNPVKSIRRPKNPPPRNRRISDAERDAIVAELDKGETGKTVAIMFLLSLQSAMRQGEICNIEPADVFRDYVHLPKTKNGDARDVPLTPKAQELVKELLGRPRLKPSLVSKTFGNAVRACKIENLRFHDARHEATTMLAGMLPNVLDLAKVTGHKDVKILLNTYYNPTASDLAAKLR